MMHLIDIKQATAKLQTQINIALNEVEINHLFAKAVLDQKINGLICIDSISNPKTFYIKHSYGMSLLFGSVTNEKFNIALLKKLLSKKENIFSEYLQFGSNAWEIKFKQLIHNALFKEETDKNITELERMNYKFNPLKHEQNSSKFNDAYRLIETTTKMAFSIKGQVVPSKFWDDEMLFEKFSKSFSVIKNNEIISTAFAAFYNKPLLEIGIETSSDFRGKGLAQWACSALISYCLQSNLEPVWACRADNIGSCKLAKSLGFEPIKKTPYYQINSNENRER